MEHLATNCWGCALLRTTHHVNEYEKVPGREVLMIAMQREEDPWLSRSANLKGWVRVASATLHFAFSPKASQSRFRCRKTWTTTKWPSLLTGHRAFNWMRTARSYLSYSVCCIWQLTCRRRSSTM